MREASKKHSPRGTPHILDHAVRPPELVDTFLIPVLFCEGAIGMHELGVRFAFDIYRAYAAFHDLCKPDPSPQSFSEGHLFVLDNHK